MEKRNNITSPKESGCRKFFNRAVSVATPAGFKNMRCPLHQEKDDNPTAAQAQPKKQQTPSVGLSNKLLKSPVIGPAAASASANSSSGHVPIIFEASSNKPVVPVNKQEHVKFVQVKENYKKSGAEAEHVKTAAASDHQKPRAGGVLPHAFTEYIEQAGAKIRAASKVGDDGKNSGAKKDSFNNKVSDYITRTRHKFHVPSYAADTTKNKKKYAADTTTGYAAVDVDK